jgi:hypothetical protein
MHQRSACVATPQCLTAWPTRQRAPTPLSVSCGALRARHVHHTNAAGSVRCSASSHRDAAAAVQQQSINLDTLRARLVSGMSAVLLCAALAGPADARQVNVELKDMRVQLCTNPVAAGVPGTSTFKVRRSP